MLLWLISLNKHRLKQHSWCYMKHMWLMMSRQRMMMGMHRMNQQLWHNLQHRQRMMMYRFGLNSWQWLLLWQYSFLKHSKLNLIRKHLMNMGYQLNKQLLH